MRSLTHLLVITLFTALLAWKVEAQGTFVVAFEHETTEAEGYGGLAITGCKKMVKENPSYKCSYIWKPTEMNYDDQLAQYLIKNFTADSSIVHVVCMGSNLAGVIRTVAAGVPKLTFSLMDSPVDSTYPSNVQGIVFSEDESGFIAGVAAGSVTSTNVVAVLGGNPVPPVQRFGFLNGVKYANPSATVLGTFLYDPRWSSVTIGPALVNKYIAQGADVMFGAGGVMGSSAILAAAQQKKWVIGVDVDEAITTFANRTEVNYLLGSALKPIDQATYVVLTEKLAGKFFSGIKKMDSTNGGVGLAKCYGDACLQLSKTSTVTDADGFTSPCAVVAKKVVSEYVSQMISRIGFGAISTGVRAGILQGVGKAFNRTWSKLEGFGNSPDGLVGHSQNQLNGNQFVFFGGQRGNGNFNNNLYFYNIDAVNWTSVAPTAGAIWPSALQYHGAVFQKATQSLYIVGGIKPDASFNQEIWKYSLSSNLWTVVKPNGSGPGPRVRHSVALPDDKTIYLWGGQDEGAAVKNELWKFDLGSSTWSLVQPSSASPEATFSSSFVAANGTDLILFGGNNGVSDLSTLWRFSTSTNSWSLESPFALVPPPALSGAASVVIDKRRVMFLGGSTAKVAQAGAYIYNAGTNEWTPESSMMLPYGLQGMTAAAFNQSQAADACSFAGAPEFILCSPVNKTIVIVYGGAQPEKGITGNLIAAYTPDEIPPKFPQYIQNSILSVGYAVGAIGIALCAIAAFATVWFRKNGAFKSASPIFLGMYAIGSAVAFLGIIIYNVPISVSSCKASLWLFSEGCMLLFSAMVVKNWRIYYIFTKARKSQSGLLQDWFMMILILILLLINTGVLIAFTVISPYQIGNVLIDGDAWPVCMSPNISTWLWILLAPSALVLLFGVYLGFATRNVTSKFNESGQITLAIYVTVLSLIILVPLSLTIKLPPTLHIMNSLLVCLTLYTVLGSNFFTKIYSAVSKPQDQFDLSGGGGGTSSLSHRDSATGEEDVLVCRTCQQPIGPPKGKAKMSGLTSVNRTENKGEKSTTKVFGAWSVNSQGTFAIHLIVLIESHQNLVAAHFIETEGYGSLAINGCKKAVAENTAYKCAFIFKPKDLSFDDGLRTYLVNQFTTDGSIVHVLFMGSNYVSIAKSVAAALPKITFSLMDSPVDSTFPQNTQGIVFPEDEAGFLAGVTAGSVTTSNVVGVLGGNPVPPVQRYVYGFLNGVKYVNPSAMVLGTFLYDPQWSSLTIGPALAQQFISQGADVLFGAGGVMGSAGILYAAQNKKWVIGVDVDEGTTTFKNRSEVNYLLNSALKNVDQATYVVLTEKANGKFFFGNKRMDVTNGGVGLSKCYGDACNQVAKSITVTESDGSAASCSSVSKKVVSDYLPEMISRLSVGAVTTGTSEGILQGVGKAFNKTWSKIEGFGVSPEGLLGHTQNKLNGNELVFFGGQRANGNLNNVLYFYNIDSVNWTSIAPSNGGVWPPAVQNHGAVFRKSTQELVVLGGTKSDGTFNQDVWKYSTSSNSWSTLSVSGKGPGSRVRHSVALPDDKNLYLWGGQDDGANVKNELWKLDLDANAWSQVQPYSSTPDATFSASLVAVNGTDLILFGGNNGVSDLSSLWRYSISSNTWKLETPVNLAPSPALSGAAGVILDKRRVMFVGGSTGKVPQAGAYVYNAGTNEWSSDSSMVLPFGLQGMTAVTFNQSESVDACKFAGTPDYLLCSPVNRTVVLVYGGAQAAKGISSSLLAAYPPDEIPPRVPQYIQDIILGIGYAVGAIGVVLSLIAIAATIWFRRNGAFKSASPTFLSMYAIGACLAFLGVISYNLPVNVMYCKAGLWLFSEGCMLLFSAMVVKNWRIFYIFHKSRTSQVAIIKDGFLLIFILILMVINTAVLGAFTFVSPYQIGNVLIDGDAWPVCMSPNIGTWIWILIAPPALVLLYGVFISFSTRNVTSKFNESGQINLAIYITVLSLVVLVPLSLTIKLPPTLHVINSLLVCLTLYTVIGTNFFTKIYTAMFKRQDLFDLTGGSSTSQMETTSTEEDVLCCKACQQPLSAGRKSNQMTMSGVASNKKSNEQPRRNDVW
ncbi:hypothetical protein HDU97_007397 [Phlyctochytrium planicorne]|nr:hypothetical protein HDU97_007397 [Phlyctochytrium planicorne]